MTDEELAAIAARADAATPGPWINLPYEDGTPGLDVHTLHGGLICEDGDGYPRGDYYPQENMVFIASARRDVPALLAEVARLRAVLTKQLAIELHAAGLRDAVASLQEHLRYDLPEVERWRTALQDCIDDADSIGGAA